MAFFVDFLATFFADFLATFFADFLPGGRPGLGAFWLALVFGGAPFFGGRPRLGASLVLFFEPGGRPRRFGVSGLVLGVCESDMVYLF